MARDASVVPHRNTQKLCVAAAKICVAAGQILAAGRRPAATCREADVSTPGTPSRQDFSKRAKILTTVGELVKPLPARPAGPSVHSMCARCCACSPEEMGEIRWRQADFQGSPHPRINSPGAGHSALLVQPRIFDR
eukprot:5162625-Prymnesium_polylepis.1